MECNTNTGGFPWLLVIQIFLIIGKLTNMPYIGNLEWWAVFIPTWFVLGWFAIALTIIAIFFIFTKD